MAAVFILMGSAGNLGGALTAKTLSDTTGLLLMAKDALAAHAHDELGISEMTTARPIQAALTSAATFTAGAARPLAIVIFAPALWEAIGSLLFLALLGAIGTRAGGAPVWVATIRVTFWRALAMAPTAGIGQLVGTAV